jgi:hypothetical protein
MAIEKFKILGAFLELPAYSTSKMVQMGYIESAV